MEIKGVALDDPFNKTKQLQMNMIMSVVPILGETSFTLITVWWKILFGSVNTCPAHLHTEAQ